MQQNAKKVTHLLQNLAKNVFFKFAPKRWSIVLFPTLKENLLKLGIKHSTLFWCKSITPIFFKILRQNLFLFCIKNAEIDYFHCVQHPNAGGNMQQLSEATLQASLILSILFNMENYEN